MPPDQSSSRDSPAGAIGLALGGDPIEADLREQDFNSINEILERVEDEVKVEFAVGLVGPFS